MTVYFQGAELEDFTGNPTGYTTNTSWYLAANARCAIQISGATDGAQSMSPRNLSLNVGEFWFHMRLKLGLAGGITSRYGFLRFLNGTTNLIELRTNGISTSDFSKLDIYKSGTTLLGSVTLPAAMNSNVFSYDVYIKLGNPGSVRVYQAGTPVYADDTLDLSFGGITTVTDVQMRTPANSINCAAYFSEIIIADWNTIGSKLVTRVPDANGAYAEMTGAYTAIDEVTPALDYVSSGTANQRSSFSMSSFPALVGGERVERVKVSVNAARDASGPQSLNIFSRVGGSDYDGSDKTLNIGATAATEAWDLSPATGANWTPTELDASEFGLRSRV